MAVNIDNNSGNNANQDTGRNDQRTVSQEARTFTSSTTPVEKKMSNAFFDPFADNGRGNQVLGRMIHPESGSEAFKRVIDLMTKATASTNGAIEIVPFAREIHDQLSYSVIAVVRTNKVPVGPGVPKHDFVTAQLFIMEATGEVPRPFEQGEGRNRFTVTPTMEDANNTLLVDYVTGNLKKLYGDETIVTLIDPMIIPRDQDLSKDDRILHQLDASITAVNTRTFVRIPGFQDYNFVARHSGNNMQLAVSTRMTGGETRTDLTNRPFYANAEVVVAIEKNGPRQQGEVFHSPSTNQDVCSASVFVDLVPVDPQLLEDNRATRRSRGRDFEPQAAWAPRLTAVHIEQYMTRTPAGILFALTSLSQLAQDRAFAETFRPNKTNRDGINLRDIGYLNIEANLDNEESGFGSPVNTSEASFDDRAMGTFLDLTVTRFPILSVDCATTGASAYYTTGLYNVARGRADTERRAQAELMHSLRCATNGLIDEYINSSDKFVDGEGELVHVGVWEDESGRVRDLREIDNYLAVAVLAAKNPSLIADWAETYYRTDVAEARRMADRWTILTSLTAGTARQTGTALRVTINNKVVDGFVNSLKDAKLPMVSRDSGNGDAFTVHRAISRGASHSLYRGNGMARYDTGNGARAGSRFAPDRY